LSGKELTFARRFMNDLQSEGYYEVTDPNELDFQFGKIAGNILKKSGKFKYAGMVVQTHDAEATYYYDDGYFLQDSTIYNPQLATMSLCLELSTWSSYDVKNWKHKSKNARELLTGEVLTASGTYEKETDGIGFKDFAQNEFWNEQPTRYSIGVVAANKKIIDVRDNGKEYTLIALAVRGGGYASEWASNFNVGYTGTHDGFTKARDNTLEFLKKYIIDKSITGDIKLWVVGFSRGGATANMVGGALNFGYELPNVSLKHKDLFVYTFEAPRGAQKASLDIPNYKDYTNIHNVVNINDIVPMVAPQQWGFVRYNYKNDYTLPSQIGSNNFFTKRDAMLREFYKLEGAREISYKVQEFSEKANLKIDKKKILPFGDPLYWWEESSISQEEILMNTIDFLAYNVVGSRDNYYRNFQSGVMEILDVLNNGSGKMDKFIAEFSEQLNASKIMEILKPIFNLNPFYKNEDRLEDVKKNIAKFVREVVDKAELNVTDVFINSLTDVLFKVFGQVIDEVWNNNTDSVNLIIKLVDLLQSESIPQAHYPEVCLAWLMSQDPNYNKNVSYKKTPSTTRIIYINCPVDVNVYNSDNTLVASIVDDIPQDVGSSIICYINEKGEKVIYLPADENYRVNIKATDDGEMSYSLREYDLLYGEVLRLINYYNIPITKGDTFTGTVNAFSDDEIESGVPDGSSVEYKLLDGSSREVAGREEIFGTDIADNYYKVTVDSDNDSGYVNGTGTFLKGNFAKVEAMPLSGSRFLGWYRDGELVSENEVYRFPVKEDVNLVAKFEHVEKHPLKLKANVGGKITSVEGFYTVGTEIAVVAEADYGYVFKNWTSSDGGTFEDENSATTTFTMPDNETTLIANFERIPGIYFFKVVAGKGGTVNTVAGSVYSEGDTIELEAIPYNGYRFKKWTSSDGGSFEDAKSPKTVFTMPANDTTITANFESIDKDSDSKGSSGKTIVTDNTSLSTGVSWSTVINQINMAKDGDVIAVDMKNETELPSDVLNALGGKNITLVLNLEKYTWSINGKNVANVPSDKTNFNLKIYKIEDSNLSKLANNKDIVILEAYIKGGYPFTATIKWNVGAEQNSNRVYLSRYNEFKNHLEYLEELRIDERNDVEFVFDSTYKYLLTEQAVGVLELKSDEIPGNIGVPNIIQAPKDIRVTKKTNTQTGEELYSFVPYLIENNKAMLIKWSSIIDNSVSFISSKDGYYQYRSNKKVFDDIKGHWAENAIVAITSRELFSGVGEGKFDPNGGMTRAMFATVLANLEGADLSEYKTSPFIDVDADSWFAASVAWADDKGIMKGYGDGLFGPNELITREQMAVILNNYMNYKGITLPLVDSASPFGDDEQISSWARSSVTKMKCLGLIKGVGNNEFAPKDTVTRASVAQLLLNLINAVIGK